MKTHASGAASARIEKARSHQGRPRVLGGAGLAAMLLLLGTPGCWVLGARGVSEPPRVVYVVDEVNQPDVYQPEVYQPEVSAEATPAASPSDAPRDYRPARPTEAEPERRAAKPSKKSEDKPKKKSAELKPSKKTEGMKKSSSQRSATKK